MQIDQYLEKEGPIGVLSSTSAAKHPGLLQGNLNLFVSSHENPRIDACLNSFTSASRSAAVSCYYK